MEESPTAREVRRPSALLTVRPRYHPSGGFLVLVTPVTCLGDYRYVVLDLEATHVQSFVLACEEKLARRPSYII
jgi:hypothetical protein